ncbi:hypothetical protein [Pseudomonas sp. UBA4194]|jgi:hypothetical protein|uniref:hypothetical protein n=1 Tax=Pseudomonas sp. UBA4194 TaxID=1947317 RepID=UPI0025FDF18F|nr:hypothetical protein [Pseudomonas sp. UBA4194]
MAYSLLLVTGAVLAVVVVLWPARADDRGVALSDVAGFVRGHYEVIGAFFLLLLAMHFCR